MRRSIFAVFVVTALGGCGKGQSKDPAAGGAGGFAMPVEVAIARRDTVVDAISATGAIEALQSIDLLSEEEGRLTEILVREGTEVREGQPLFRLDESELKALVAKAEAERDLAAQALKRTQDLQAQNASSASDLERAEATARSTQADLDLLKLRLSRTVIRAPFAGLVGQRFVSLGDFVTQSTKLASLHTVDPQRAAFQVPERYARRLKLGQRVSFKVAAIPREEFTGEVDFVDPVVQLPARTILVKARVPNRRRLLQPGMFIEASLATETRSNAVVIPEDAVLPLQGADFAWVVRDSKATRRQIGLGVRTTGFVEVTSGLDAGDQVVVGGQERLSEGAAVNAKVVERKPVVAKEE